MKTGTLNLLINIHFFLILLTGIILAFFSNNEIKPFAPIIYLFGSTVFFFLFYTYQMYSFSSVLEKKRPDFYKKHSLKYSALKGDVLFHF